MNQETTPENGRSSVPLDKIVSWVEKEMAFHCERKEKHLHDESPQAYQFHAGCWKALSEVHEQLNKQANDLVNLLADRRHKNGGKRNNCRY
ncbi:MAG: hypothetical protein D3910_06975 [Candidatus Electrothrix sp. ATG2]|nr:hypothetical protein [Candidatus Electrothrix sp. ATG2]